MNLSELDAAIGRCINKETGEITNTEAFLRLQSERVSAAREIERRCMQLKSIISEAETLRDEITKLTEQKRALEDEAAKLESEVAAELGEGHPLETAQIKCKWRESTRVDISGDVPPEYRRIVFSPDKKAIKDAILSGIHVEGASLKKYRNLNVEMRDIK